jgi:hypothetical protein
MTICSDFYGWLQGRGFGITLPCRTRPDNTVKNIVHLIFTILSNVICEQTWRWRSA